MDVCQFLVASNADVNAKNNLYDSHPYTRNLTCVHDLGFVFERCYSHISFSEMTPLHWSSFKDHVDVCQFLVASKADMTTRDRCRFVSSAALLCSAAHPLRCSNGLTPLKLAIQEKKSDVAAYLRSVEAQELTAAAVVAASAQVHLRCCRTGPFTPTPHPVAPFHYCFAGCCCCPHRRQRRHFEGGGGRRLAAGAGSCRCRPDFRS